MHLLVAASNLEHAWEKIRGVPTSFWVYLLATILCVFLVVRIWRALKDFNDFAPYIALFVVVSFGLLFVVYERKEPAFMTPFVDTLAEFLPTKGTTPRHEAPGH